MISRRRFSLLGLAAAGSALVGLIGNADAKPVVPQSAKVEVARAVEAFRKAMVAGDGRRLTDLSAPGLRFGHSNGMVQSRAEFVRTVVTKQEIFRSIKLLRRSQTVAGNTAVARHVFAADILLGGKPIKVKLNCVEVWHKSGGKWRLLSRQAYKPASPV